MFKYVYKFQLYKKFSKNNVSFDFLEIFYIFGLMNYLSFKKIDVGSWNFYDLILTSSHNYCDLFTCTFSKKKKQHLANLVYTYCITIVLKLINASEKN